MTDFRWLQAGEDEVWEERKRARANRDENAFADTMHSLAVLACSIVGHRIGPWQEWQGDPRAKRGRRYRWRECERCHVTMAGEAPPTLEYVSDSLLRVYSKDYFPAWAEQESPLLRAMLKAFAK